MIQECEQVITWLQQLTVVSVLGNLFMAGLLAACIGEMRACRRARDGDKVGEFRPFWRWF
jgi:hypothetical protein